jgi:O-antigen/teichoic acid export membrane protein
MASAGCSAFLILAIVGFLWCGKFLLSFWVGPQYIDDVYLLLTVLLLANGVRNVMAPYSVMLISVGAQRKAIVPALVEGLVNLVASVLLARSMGALGVAYGTLIGAGAGVLASTLLVVNKTPMIIASRAAFVQKILLLPMGCLVLIFFLTNN